MYAGRVVEALHDAGQHVPDHLLSSLSPLSWEHVNLTGDYIWEDKPALDYSGFRPLPFSV
ncbi:Tn3 family transposase [Agrobacterium salinitolerans]|uniref:Tn3 family transposase n=1 Tax=Agrobacterium salinitolerans TaxID=1183413 RepID=UPI00265DEAD2|nr:Tn3 family transposase [Agrobacterium salinitolerans]